jgi:hypothetical protein
VSDWIAACDAYLGESLPALRAFGGLTPGEPVSFERLEHAGFSERERLAQQIPRVLAGEVDTEQALLFARRFGSAVDVLSGLEGPQARVLRIALIRRTQQVLEDAPPRALRVRAVADFFTSQAALLHHRDTSTGAPTLDDKVAELQWHPAGPGVDHARLSGPTQAGPVHINCLTVAAGVRLRTLDCRGMGTLTELAARHRATAGVSGGFFLYSEPDISPPSQRGDPVGLLVDRGVLVNPPVFRRGALVQGDDLSARLAIVGMVGARIGTETVTDVNTPAALAPLFNRAWGAKSPALDRPSAAIVGCEVVQTGHGSLPIPLAGFVFMGHRPLRLGPIDIRLADTPQAAIAGGPLLHQLDLAAEDFSRNAPPITFSSDETFDQNLLPRMVVGQRPDGGLVFAAIDGRHFHRAPGMTLEGAWNLLQCLGCTRGLNLDGGSSKRMVVGGRSVDMSTTEIVTQVGAMGAIRPVHTAVLIGVAL